MWKKSSRKVAKLKSSLNEEWGKYWEKSCATPEKNFEFNELFHFAVFFFRFQPDTKEAKFEAHKIHKS